MVARDEIGILVVEPSDTYQRILEALLKRLGFHRIQKVNNPMKAQVLLQHDKSINVVLAELMIPSPERGVALVRDLRKKYSAEELPILMLTNLSEKEYVQQAISAGVNGYLIKPIDPDHLEAHLWRLFDLPLRGQQRMGEYMVQQGVISPEERDVALKFQKEYSSEYHSMAVVALFLGYVNEKQLISTVFKHQLDDEAFFEWAKPLGLTPEQVAHLRKIKNEHRLRIGDIMVKFGFITEEQLQQVLLALNKECD